MLVRSFGNNFQVQDWTEELNVIPNTYVLLVNLVFSKMSQSQPVLLL